MAELSVRDSAAAGFRLLVRRPLTVLAWSLVAVSWFGGLLWLFLPTIVNVFTTLVWTQRGGAVSPSTLFAALGSLVEFLIVLALGGGLLGTVISSAVYRAILEPDSSAFFYLRCGAREARLLLVLFVQNLLMFLTQTALSAPVGILFMIGRQAHASLVVIGLVTTVARILAYVVTVWIYARLAMSGPMTFTEQRFRLFESWALTRGHDLRLSGVGLAVAIMDGTIWFIIVLIIAMGFVSSFGVTNGGDLKTAVEGLSSTGLLLKIGPLFGAGLIVLLAGAAVLIPVSIAPWPEIYRKLSVPDDLAEAFT